jgi:hypothetical protein
MAEIEPPVVSTFVARDLFLFLCAVLVGTTAGIGSQQAFLHLTSPQIAANLSPALATTCTGAAHSRLVHRKPIRYLLPSLVAGTPVAFGAMRVIHFIIGL